MVVNGDFSGFNGDLMGISPTKMGIAMGFFPAGNLIVLWRMIHLCMNYLLDRDI